MLCYVQELIAHHAASSNPSSFVATGSPTVGGYISGSVNNTPYAFGDSTYSLLWTGASYQTGPWTLAAWFYYYHPDYYKASASSIPCSNNSAGNCAGVEYTASLGAVYSVNKHLDLYGLVTWSELKDGLSVGYNTPEETAILTGLILKF